jgi:hypothetical protein
VGGLGLFLQSGQEADICTRRAGALFGRPVQDHYCPAVAHLRHVPIMQSWRTTADIRLRRDYL